MEYFPLIMLVLLAVLLFVLPARQRRTMQARAQALQESLTVGTPEQIIERYLGYADAVGEPVQIRHRLADHFPNYLPPRCCWELVPAGQPRPQYR